MNCNFMALHYEIYSSSVTWGGLVCLSLKTEIVGGETSTRVIQYGGVWGGDPLSLDPCPPSWRPVPHIKKILSPPPISQNCWCTSRDFLSLHIVLWKKDTYFSYILPNKGQNSYLNPVQILSGIMCPHPIPPILDNPGRGFTSNNSRFYR